VADEMPPATGAPDPGRTAYEAENAWLSKIMPGAQHPSWDELDPEYQEVYRRIAGAVAAAERERIAVLAEKVEAVYDEDGDGVAKPFAGLIRDPG
jgi:TRAP-type C4-dicarboxylate transport system substrate-binding protein